MLKKKGPSKKGAPRQTFMDLHQPAAASIKDVVKSGYLMKEGGSYKSWKSRYFVVDGNTHTMYYYAKPKDKKPLGFIPLWDCKVEPNVDREFQNCFEVNHPDRRTFYMVTTSPKELNEWVEVLRKCVRDGIKARKNKVTSFWQRAFGNDMSVKWPQFRDALKEHLTDDFDTQTEDRIHFVLATLALKSQPKDEVHVGQVHLYTELLGSLQSSYKNLAEICMWYHGALTSADAEAKLEKQPEGTFLLRLRRFAADSGLLALSVVGKKGITHTNLYKEPISELYFTGYHEPVFATVQELVHAHPMCSKPADTQVYRDCCQQFEAARLAVGTNRGDLSPRQPDSVAPSPPVITAKRPAASVPDDAAFSPREPIAGTLTLPATPAVTIVDTKPLVSEPQASPSTDVLPDTEAVPSATPSPDGAPVVAAVSGVTTFNAMHQPSARAVRDVLKTGWLMCIMDSDAPQRAWFVLSAALKTLYFFNTPDDDSPIDFVPLWGCDVAEAQDVDAAFCFEVSHPDRRSFYMQAQNEAEMNDWANALLTVIDEWKEDQVRKRERFWREHFGSRKEVTWGKFIESLQLETGTLSPSQERHLRFMIGTFAAKNQQPDTLKSRQLFLFVELFGALTTCYNQLGRVCLWYQGSLTSSDAMARLDKQPDGTFLLRLRRFSADAGLLAMSYVDEGETKHINVFRDPLSECYYLQPDEPVYSSLQALVEGHPSLRPLPPASLGRAYREFKEKSGDPPSEEEEAPKDAAVMGAVLVSPRVPVPEGDQSDQSESPRANESDDEELRRSAVAAEAARRQQEELDERRRLEEAAERQRAVVEAERAALAQKKAEAEAEAQRAAEAERERRLQEQEQRRLREEREAARAAEAARLAEEERRAAEEEMARRAEEERQEALREEEAARLEEQRREDELRAAEAARREEQKRAAETARREEQQRAAEAARREQEKQRAAAEAARREEQQRAAEAARREEEKRAAEAARREQEQRAAAEAARREEQEASRRELEKQRAAAEAARRDEERRAAAEAARREDEKRAAEEKQRAAADAARREQEKQRAAAEAARREEEKRAAAESARREEQQRAGEAARRAEAERRRELETDAQARNKAEQARRVEAQKAKIEEERRKLEAERQARLAAQGRVQSAPRAGVTTAYARGPVSHAPTPAPSVAATPSASVVEAQPDDGEAGQFPEFAKETKVERLYKERMMAARAGADVSPVRPAGAPSLAAPATVAPRRDSRVIQVDVEKVREILQYLSDLEDKQALTESEVYKLEHLITVNKDQLVLGYYMTFSGMPETFVKKCRRHLQHLPDTAPK